MQCVLRSSTNMYRLKNNSADPSHPSFFHPTTKMKEETNKQGQKHHSIFNKSRKYLQSILFNMPLSLSSKTHTSNFLFITNKQPGYNNKTVVVHRKITENPQKPFSIIGNHINHTNLLLPAINLQIIIKMMRKTHDFHFPIILTHS